MIINSAYRQMQDEYPQFDELEWGKRIKYLIGDIIRNARRNKFRRGRINSENLQKPTTRGRPRFYNNKRVKHIT